MLYQGCADILKPVNPGARFCSESDECCIQNDGFCTDNDGFCIKNDGFCCITNDGFCRQPSPEIRVGQAYRLRVRNSHHRILTTILTTNPHHKILSTESSPKSSPGYGLSDWIGCLQDVLAVYGYRIAALAEPAAVRGDEYSMNNDEYLIGLDEFCITK